MKTARCREVHTRLWPPTRIGVHSLPLTRLHLATCCEPHRSRAVIWNESCAIAGAQMQGEVRHWIRASRTDRLKQGGDDIERSDAHRRETSSASCVECAKEIAERRLPALPFAVRCQACEAKREGARTGTTARAAPPATARIPSTGGIGNVS
jgi:hypothetical protein